MGCINRLEAYDGHVFKTHRAAFVGGKEDKGVRQTNRNGSFGPIGRFQADGAYYAVLSVVPVFSLVGLPIAEGGDGDCVSVARGL